jgi:ABC-type dipeptide/oligopeptide/nickel transport system ATPase component
MTEGRIVELGLVSQIFDAPEAAYTRQLLENTPSIEAALARVGQSNP